MNKEQNQVSGFLLINKPSGPTSHDIIDELRQVTGVKRIGHAGTLDPFASGLLIVGIGREATKELGKFLRLDKTYEAVLKLGATSDTHDLTGKIQVTRSKVKKITNNQSITKQKIEKVLNGFIGEQEQIPPMFSAKKHHGKKLYELARKGMEVERKPVKVMIYAIKLLSYTAASNQLKIECRVSSGTYIRSLAHDIGQVIGVGAYLEELTRTQIGDYKLEDAININQLNPNNWTNFLTDLES